MGHEGDHELDRLLDEQMRQEKNVQLALAIAKQAIKDAPCPYRHLGCKPLNAGQCFFEVAWVGAAMVSGDCWKRRVLAKIEEVEAEIQIARPHNKQRHEWIKGWEHVEYVEGAGHD